MGFRKGESGNPTGPARGVLNYATLLAQELLAARVESIAGKLIELAEGGDMRAIRVLVERLMPVIKDRPIAVRAAADREARRQRCSGGSHCGGRRGRRLTAAEAARLAKVVDVYVHALDSEGFDEPLGELEKEIGARGRASPCRKVQRHASEARSCRPRKVLTELTKFGGRQPRTHALWVDEHDTPADIDAERDRLIAEGRHARRYIRVRALEGPGEA